MNDIKKILQIINEDANDVAKGIAKDIAAPVATGTAATKIATKMGSKIIPGVGTALSWKDAYDRWKEGDRSGAVIAALAGTAFMVPGPGTAIGAGLDAVNIGRDIKAGDYDELGQMIKDKIAKENKMESNMKESERIAQLRDRLDQIDEGPLSWLKNLGKGAKGGKTPPPGAPGGPAKVDPSMYPPPAVRPNTAVGAAKTPPKTDPNVIDVDAKVVKPGMSTGQKAAAGAAVTAAGAGAGYMAGKDGQSTSGSSANPSAVPNQSDAETARLARQNAAAGQPTSGSSANPPAATGSASGSSANPPASALSTDEEGEMGVLAQELGQHMGRLPELDALLLRYEKLRPKAADAAP